MTMKKEMNQDTIELLSEINAGCKMAISSMEQVGRNVDDKKLKDIIRRYTDEHIEVQEQTHRILNSVGESEKEPGIFAKTFASLQTEIKMLMKDDVHQASSILIDGCNMGTKSLCEYKNQYKAADDQSVHLCEKLCDIEKRMIEELQPLL